MKRPLASKRPIGPFFQNKTQFANTENLYRGITLGEANNEELSDGIITGFNHEVAFIKSSDIETSEINGTKFSRVKSDTLRDIDVKTIKNKPVTGGMSTSFETSGQFAAKHIDTPDGYNLEDVINIVIELNRDKIQQQLIDVTYTMEQVNQHPEIAAWLMVAEGIVYDGEKAIAPYDIRGGDRILFRNSTAQLEERIKELLNQKEVISLNEQIDISNAIENAYILLGTNIDKELPYSQYASLDVISERLGIITTDTEQQVREVYDEIQKMMVSNSETLNILLHTSEDPSEFNSKDVYAVFDGSYKTV